MHRITFPPLLKIIFDVVATSLAALLSALLFLRMPRWDAWNYTSGTLFLTGVILVIAGSYLVLWAIIRIAHDPKTVWHTVHKASAVLLALSWLAVVAVGVLAILALYIRQTTNLVTWLLHLAYLSDDRYVSQIVAERSGLAGLIVVVIVTEFVWNRPEWLRAIATYAKDLAHGKTGRSSPPNPGTSPRPPSWSQTTGQDQASHGSFLESALRHDEE